MKQKFASKPATAATAAWPSGARSLFPAAAPRAATAGAAATWSWSVSQRHNTLIHFRYNPEHKAQRGEHGMGSNCTGLGRPTPSRCKVPVGTALYDLETGELVHDFQQPDERFVVAKGGRGGRGNQHFATSIHQAPREHELGRAGEERSYRLELKLLADVGLVGYPNAGKSTLISRISAAKPKIADYPFTTLEPNLGVVTVGEEPDQESFVVADMPGLIEGAHLGSGWARSFCATLSARGCWCIWSMYRTPADGPILSKTSR